MRLKRFIISALTFAFLLCNVTTAFAGSWKSTNEGWKYEWSPGVFCENGWVQYKNHWFYFGSNQLLRTGWIQKDGAWYFASDSGALQAGLLKINGNVYYMDSNSCKLVTGNRTAYGITYNFTENGTTNGMPYVYTEWNSNGTLRRGVNFNVR